MNIDFPVLLKSIVTTVVLAVALVIVQMWFDIFKGIIFWKLLATLGLVGLLASFLIAIKQDLSQDKNLRDDKFID